MVPSAATPAQPSALIIDDSEDCRQIAVYVLEQLGCRCLIAATAKEGLSLAIASAPDIIILDVVLPDVSGLDFLRQFKQHIQAKETAVIAVTALASPADREQLLKAGCVSYLSKPYLLQDLINLVSPHLADDSQQPTDPFAPYSVALQGS